MELTAIVAGSVCGVAVSCVLVGVVQFVRRRFCRPKDEDGSGSTHNMPLPLAGGAAAAAAAAPPAEDAASTAVALRTLNSAGSLDSSMDMADSPILPARSLGLRDGRLPSSLSLVGLDLPGSTTALSLMMADKRALGTIGAEGGGGGS